MNINNIITIGPDYRFPNGGIAKLINTYSKLFIKFNFVSTMRAPKQGKESKIITLFRMLSGLFKMTWMILFNNCKITHIHTASGISFLRESIFLYLASLLGAKTILHIHSGSLKEFYEAHPKLVKKSLNKADVVVTIAKIWKKYLNDKGHTNVVTIGNTINLPLPTNKSKYNMLNILFLGLICDNKGIWDILEMLKEHKEQLNGKIKLKVGGNGEVDKLLNYISENRLSGLVEYIGWIEGNEKAAVLSNTDIYLQPSYREALGIAILEAMSYKIPVIATNTGGIPEIVHDGKNGYLITPGDKESLFIALKDLIESEDKRIKFGANGFRIAKEYYPEVIKEKLVNLYNSLL